MNPHQSDEYTNFSASFRRPGRRFVRSATAIALGIVCLSSVPAQQGAQNPGIPTAIAAEPDVPHLVVTGSTGTVGMDADHTDELVFVDGNFHSRECSKLGFRKSEAQVKRDGDVIRFSAVSVSPKYGTLSWEGTIRDGAVQALYIWKKERMFWTIQRKYWFSGAVQNAAIKNGEVGNAVY